jgi:hypothetical protein
VNSTVINMGIQVFLLYTVIFLWIDAQEWYMVILVLFSWQSYILISIVAELIYVPITGYQCMNVMFNIIKNYFLPSKFYIYVSK